MRHFRGRFLGVLGMVCLTASLASADVKVDKQPLGAQGESVGCSISPHGGHVAVLAAKGSRYVVYMDGVAGPRIDALLNTGGSFFTASSPGGWVGEVPILFSDDGAHWAYCYKSGDDTVIMLDGKEVARGPMQPNLQMPLTFSIGGKHFAWGYDNRIFMDGKPGPQSRYAPQLFFSPDGSRYAYLGTQPGGNAQWAVVDGRQVNYFGEINQFAPNNHLISLLSDPASHSTIFVLDGKPEFKAAGIGRVWTSPDGKQIAVQLTPDQNSKQVLMVNGKVVPGTEGMGIFNVFFSPDGKRYAVHCSTPGNSQFMIIDGKKGDEYASIPEQVGPDNAMQMQWAYPTNTAPLPRIPAFTADSSKFIYTASAAGRCFLMTEDGEYDDFTGDAGGLAPVLSPVGGHYGFIGQSTDRKQAVVIDGKAQVLGQLGVIGQQIVSCLSFSPDGSHSAFINGTTLYVDGSPMPGGILGQRYIFSPDGKHIAYYTYQTRLAMDGKLLQTDAMIQGAIYAIFSADSRHVYWITPGQLPNTKDDQQLFVDGKAVAHFTDIGLGHGATFNYEISPEGVLTFITRTDGQLTRFVVTPDSNIDAMLAAAKPVPTTN